MEEALVPTRFATKVTLVHRRDEFRASPIMLDRARNNQKIEFVTNAEVDEVLGDEKVDGVRLRDTGPTRTWDIEADGVFVAIGHDPNTELFVDQLDHDDERLPRDEAGLHRDEHPGRLRRRRRPGPHLPAGRHRRRHRAAWRRSTRSASSPRTKATRPQAARRSRQGLAPASKRGRWPRTWIDLLDPDEEELREQGAVPLQESAYRLLLTKPVHEDEPRPKLESHGDYVFGVFLVAVAIRDEIASTTRRSTSSLTATRS